MQFNNLKPEHKTKPARRIGRGGKRGTYSGRGIKGQKSRAGANIRPAIRDLIKKFPKKRGVYFKSIQVKPEIIKLVDLEKKLENGTNVNPKVLIEKGLISLKKGHMPKVKILSNGEITKKFFVSDCVISKLAQEKIIKAGGTVK